jgi:hypothetical protein
VIRINLLKHLPAPDERLHAMLNPTRSGGFISRRETMLGGLFLALAAAILGSQLWLSRGAGSADVEPSAPRPVVSPAPAPRQQQPQPPVQAAQPEPEPEDSEARQVAEAFAALPPAELPAAPAVASESPAPQDGAMRITAVNATPAGEGLDIFLAVAGSPTIRSLRVDNPSRLVFDIPGVILAAPPDQRVQRLEGPLVSRLRIAQNVLDPPLVRLVLEVPEFPAATSSVSADGVAIRVRRP